MQELGDDKLESGEKEAIESAISELEEAIKGGDKDAIETKTKALAEASGKMAERMYSQQQGGAEAGGAAGGTQDAGGAADAGKAEDDVVDAEFEEVKDGK
jgi:molecular chaperone DnaK